MRKLLALGLFLCLFSGLAAAEKLEVFGGAQYTHFDPNFNLAGWNGAATLGLNRWIGVTGDFGGVYRSGIKFHTYTVGPELRASFPGAKLFVHALVGGAKSSSGGFSDNGLAGFVGGGMDVGGGPFAFRLVQVDWMATRFGGVTTKKNVRAAAGIVFRF